MKTILILGILSLFVMLSCSTIVKERAEQQNVTEMNKKNIGNLLTLSDQTPLNPANNINNFIQ